MIKVKGYVICMPASVWAKDISKFPWHPREHSFGKTATEAWIRFMNLHPNDYQWDKQQTYWIDRGYCVKEATLEVKV